MAGSACYNIVYMRERVSTSNTYRVTGGDRKINSSTSNKKIHHSFCPRPKVWQMLYFIFVPILQLFNTVLWKYLCLVRYRCRVWFCKNQTGCGLITSADSALVKLSTFFCTTLAFIFTHRDVMQVRIWREEVSACRGGVLVMTRTGASPE